MAQLNDKLVEEGDASATTDPYVYKMKDSVVYIKNLQENAKFFSLLRINTTAALCIGIEKAAVTALVLGNMKDVKSGSPVDLHPAGDIHIPLRSLGNVIDFSGQCLLDDCTENLNVPEVHWGTDTVSVMRGLRKAPYKRRVVSNQLYTGHLRIDLNQPMVENNFIVLKGPSNAGKNIVVQDMIKYFLKHDKEDNRRVVFVTPFMKDSKNLYQRILTEDERSK